MVLNNTLKCAIIQHHNRQIGSDVSERKKNTLKMHCSEWIKIAKESVIEKKQNSFRTTSKQCRKALFIEFCARSQLTKL